MNWIATYSHNGQIGVLVDVQALTDGIRSKEVFIELCRDIAMHVAASNPADIAELLSQPFVKNPDKNILDLLNEKSESLQDSISVSRFMRWDTSTHNHENDPRHDPAIAMQVNRA